MRAEPTTRPHLGANLRRIGCWVAMLAGVITTPGSTAEAETVLEAVAGIEAELDARVGFFLLDTQTGETIAHHSDDRFALNSTFKLFACGALLDRLDAGQSDLTADANLSDYAVVDYSPAILDVIDAGRTTVSLGEACAMMLSVSDNTAANIVLAEIGGPEGFTQFMRALGDDQTRLDRWETDLNAAVPGDERDTTTPKALALAMEALLLDDTLSARSLAQLKEWLSHHRVADGLFRASLPASWSIEDRTGAGGYGSRSIVAVLYPPNRAPVVAALFMTETEAAFQDRNAAAARVGAAIVAHIGAE